MASVDYSVLDHIGISMNAFYPRKNWSSTPPGASDHFVAVDDEISLSCRFFPAGASAAKQPTTTMTSLPCTSRPASTSWSPITGVTDAAEDGRPSPIC